MMPKQASSNGKCTMYNVLSVSGLVISGLHGENTSDPTTPFPCVNTTAVEHPFSSSWSRAMPTWVLLPAGCLTSLRWNDRMVKISLREALTCCRVGWRLGMKSPIYTSRYTRLQAGGLATTWLGHSELDFINRANQGCDQQTGELEADRHVSYFAMIWASSRTQKAMTN